MQENNDKNQGKNGLSFESLDILIAKWKDGTFSEIIDDWKWIFSYSVRYKWAIVFYTILGIFSTSMGLVSSVAGKYLIDIITGYKTNKLMILIIVMVGSSLFSLLFSSIISRISTKLSIYINNDIQADIFDKIVDADWLEINKYSNGDVLNRFNGDIGTVSSNAISWLPTIVIAIYNFIATFLVILHYNAVMAILALASAPFMLLMSRFMIKKQREYSQKTREMSSKLMTFEVEAFYNFDTIKSFGIAPHYSRLMRWWQGKFKDVSLEYNMFSIKTNIELAQRDINVEKKAYDTSYVNEYASGTAVINGTTVAYDLIVTNKSNSPMSQIKLTDTDSRAREYHNVCEAFHHNESKLKVTAGGKEEHHRRRRQAGL